MNTHHISTARLIQAAEGLELESADLIHFRSCLDCQKLLSALSRNLTHALQETRQLVVVDQSDVSHLPIQRVWEFAHDRADLGDDDYQHLRECELCVAVLGICRTATSLERVIEILKEHGFNLQ